MLKFIYRIRIPAYCLMVSFLVHIVFMYSLRMFGSYDFSAPVNQPLAVMVDLADPSGTAAAAQAAEDQKASDPERAAEDVVAPKTPEKRKQAPPVAAKADQEADEPEDVDEDDSAEVKTAHADPPAEPPRPVPAKPAPTPAVAHSDPAKNTKVAATTTKPTTGTVRAGGALLSSKYEKLTYVITKLGMTVGSAELEAKYDQGVTTITMRVKSSALVSAVYPVDNVIETSHIQGMYIVSKIRQHEDTFQADETLTINQLKKKVSWMDLLQNRSLEMTVPTDDVLDTLSGIYSLRNLNLQVGKTETLHIFDSETYADVPVEILRKEEIRLPNLSKIKTLVVRPIQKTAGMFRRTGDVFIWMTDDANKVPVKIVTSVAIGTVTAELVSAETKPHDPDTKGVTRQASVSSATRGPEILIKRQ
jgi:hypothetical protein